MYFIAWDGMRSPATMAWRLHPEVVNAANAQREMSLDKIRIQSSREYTALWRVAWSDTAVFSSQHSTPLWLGSGEACQECTREALSLSLNLSFQRTWSQPYYFLYHFLHFTTVERVRVAFVRVRPFLNRISYQNKTLLLRKEPCTKLAAVSHTVPPHEGVIAESKDNSV